MTAAAAAPAARAMALGEFRLLALSYCLASTQFWMTVPLAALSLAGRGVPAWEIGVLGVVPWLVLVAVIPWAPRLAAALGVMAAYRLGLALALGGALLFAAGHALWTWGVAYALCGAGIAIRWIVADTLIAALAPLGERGHRIGIFETLVGGTMALGPAVLALTGVESRLPYLLGVALIVVALLPTFCFRLEAPLEAGGAALRSLWLGVRAQPLPMLVAGTAGLIEGTATKLFPVQALGLGFDTATAAMTVTAFGAGNLLTQYLTGWTADRLGVLRLVRAALAASLVLALLVPLAAATRSGYALDLCLLGGLVGALYTLAVVDAGRSGAPQQVMAVIAGISVAYTLGSVLGPLLGGAATSADLVWGLPLLMALTCGGVLALLAGRPAPSGAVRPAGRSAAGWPR